MTKDETPLTLDEKLELIKSGEKFVVPRLGDAGRWFDSEYDMRISLKAYERGSVLINLGEFLREDVYKYEEPEEEWVDTERLRYYPFWIDKEASVPKSWIEEKARECGMEYKNDSN